MAGEISSIFFSWGYIVVLQLILICIRYLPIIIAAHAKLHGTLGCCIATSGPGAAHLLSGLVDADQDRVPLLCITGMKSSDHVRYADFQDIDQASIFRMAGLGKCVCHYDHRSI